MRDASNIQTLEQLGIDWMGMIFWPKSKRYVSEIPSYLPRQVKRVGVFVDADLEEIRQHIKDYQLDADYAAQTRDQLARGDKIDLQGMQMHLFNPADCEAIAQGAELRSPAQVRAQIAAAHSGEGMPIHLSEITISAPGGDERGEIVQAEIARNLYRLWFSLPDMVAITWWNVVDDCGAPGEPSVSGLFHRDMTPKKSYFALDRLINDEWRTRTTVRAGADGAVAFRGFRGAYRLAWRDASGTLRERKASI